MLANLIILIWGLKQRTDPYTGQRIVAQGDCNAMRNGSAYWHLAINVFSTLLLATSNVAMQCLSAPKRAAVRMRTRSFGTKTDRIAGRPCARRGDAGRHWHFRPPELAIYGPLVEVALDPARTVHRATLSSLQLSYLRRNICQRVLGRCCGAGLSERRLLRPTRPVVVLNQDSSIPTSSMLSNLSSLAAKGALQRLKIPSASQLRPRRCLASIQTFSWSPNPPTAPEIHPFYAITITTRLRKWVAHHTARIRSVGRPITTSPMAATLSISTTMPVAGT
jgi:hypothetical protein